MKKILSVLLAVMLLISALSVCAFADEAMPLQPAGETGNVVSDTNLAAPEISDISETASSLRTTMTVWCVVAISVSVSAAFCIALIVKKRETGDRAEIALPAAKPQ